MKIFPTKSYEFKLLNDSANALSELEKNTYISDSLSSEWTEKAFIGKLNNNEFRIISSKRGRGAFCVLNGKLDLKTGTVEITIHKTFRILLSLIFLFPIIGFIITLLTKEIDNSILLIIPTLMSLIVFRFIFTELAFRIISNNSLKKLIEVIGIAELR